MGHPSQPCGWARRRSCPPRRGSPCVRLERPQAEHLAIDPSIAVHDIVDDPTWAQAQPGEHICNLRVFGEPAGVLRDALLLHQRQRLLGRVEYRAVHEEIMRSEEYQVSISLCRSHDAGFLVLVVGGARPTAYVLVPPGYIMSRHGEQDPPRLRDRTDGPRIYPEMQMVHLLCNLSRVADRCGFAGCLQRDDPEPTHRRDRDHLRTVPTSQTAAGCRPLYWSTWPDSQA